MWLYSLLFYHFCTKTKAKDLQVPPGRAKQYRCAFFNYSGGPQQTGGWSNSGIETVTVNSTHVRCISSHLTTFVVLVTTVSDQVSDTVLFEMHDLIQVYNIYVLDVVEAHCYVVEQTNCEQICRRYFADHGTLFCTQLTKAYAAETSCICCYWFCYVSAHNQFAQYLDACYTQMPRLDN